MGIERSSITKRTFGSGRKLPYKAALIPIVCLMLIFGTTSNYMLPGAYAANTLTVEGFALDGRQLSMWIAVQSNGSTVKTGFTPLTFTGDTGASYSITAHDYSGGSVFFDHWDDGSTSRTITFALNTDVTFTAYYRTPGDASSRTLTVNAYDQNSIARNMYTTIREADTTVETGFTPLTFEGTAGATYSVTVSNYGSLVFDYWENGDIDRVRTIMLDEDTSITAYYFDEAAETTPSEQTDAAPSATDDSETTHPDTPVTIDVLANDSDADGDALTVTSVTDPANGNATNNGDGTVTYTPTSGFTGTDSFSYTISDDNGNSASGEVTVTVTAVSTAASQLPISYELAVNAEDMSGNAKTGMYTTISEGSTTVRTGFTPVSYTGTADSAYSVTVYNYRSSVFDHWDDGSTERTRAVTLNSDMVMTAYYRVPELELTPASGIGGSTTITTTGYYFSPDSSVTVTYNGQTVASVNTNSTGSFSTSFLAPSSGAGMHTVHAEDSNGWEASSSFEDTTAPEPRLNDDDALQKTGVFVALYMYPGSTGSVHWQKVIDEKKEHPSVPIVAIFNPSSGPGSSKNSNIAYWVDKLQDAGVTAIGYVADDYGTKSLSSLRSDTDKYVNWYGADGLFIDEFTNKVGYEGHYQQITDYAKSRGMELTMGNPGTDVPPSYIGTVDVINTSEGRGYTSLTDPNLVGSSWVSGGYSGWHEDHGKDNFSIIRYDISSLDTSYVDAVSDWVGLVYITDGNDSNHRWFHVPPYFGELVAALDQ